jgi:hypothetical protein
MTVNDEAVRLKVSIRGGQCWVRVEADGRLVEEGLIESGADRAWEASRHLAIRVGAPWTMNLYLNGVDMGSAGPEGSPAKDLDIHTTR